MTRWVLRRILPALAGFLVPVVAVCLVVVIAVTASVMAGTTSVAAGVEGSGSGYGGGAGVCRLDPAKVTVVSSGPYGRSVTVADDQILNAATIVSVGSDKGVSSRDQVIALMVAMQESSLRNLDYGDLDSVGLFQQRPSQGWGTVDQIMDPVYAAGAFYDKLLALTGRESMTLNDAAQEVQRSGTPDAYGPHQADAEALNAALWADTSAVACGLASGGLSLVQAQALMATYATADSVSWGVFSCGCNGGCMANCVSLSVYFMNRFTSSWVSGATGNGGQVVGTLLTGSVCGGSCGLVDGGHVPKPYAVFSRTSGSMLCDGVPCGHTGVVLGVDQENDEIIVGEASCGDPSFTGAHVYSLSAWSTEQYVYAYTDAILTDISV